MSGLYCKGREYRGPDTGDKEIEWMEMYCTTKDTLVDRERERGGRGPAFIPEAEERRAMGERRSWLSGSRAEAGALTMQGR